MKALTVQQPWAWAIIHGGKNIENRTRAWRYRGPLLIHAGARISDRGMSDDRIGKALRDTGHAHFFGAPILLSRVIGVVDLIDTHRAETACCEPWGETSYVEHGGRPRRRIFHLELENPRPLDRPVECPGRLGLWTPDEDVQWAVRDQSLEAKADG